MKRGRWIISMTIAICAAAAFAYGLSSSEQVFKNHLHTGSVLVKVTEFEELDGQIKPIRGDELFMEAVKDGKLVSYIPRVTALADDSYVRLKVRITGNDDISIPVNDDTIRGVGDSWVRKGSSFYCRHIMAAGEEEDPFAGILVPMEMEQIKKIHVEVTADAIQAVNLQPDFASADPWAAGAGSVHAGTANGEPYHVVFRKEQKVECGSTDLFDNFSTFMPGDLKTGTLLIDNQTGKDADIYLQTAAANSELLHADESAAENPAEELQKNMELLQKMKLTIRCENKTVYSGSLLSEDLQDKVRIASLRNQSADTLQFELTLPADADNRFASAAEDVEWILSIQDIEKASAEEDASGRGVDQVSSAGEVITGDRILPLMIAAGLAALAMIVIALTIAFGRRRT